MKNEEIRNVAKLGRTGTGPRHSQLFFHAHNMSQCCTISFVKHWHTHTARHTHRHGHTLSTQLLTHVYACHIIKHIKHIMGRVCHRHAYTLQPHTHTCLHWWEGQGQRKSKRGEAERLSLSYTQRHLQLLEQTQCLFGCLRCELTWRAKNELAKHVTKVTQHNGAAHTLKHTHKHTQACKQSSRSSLLEHTIRAA